MPESAFRGDPYRVLDVSRSASADEVKRRWRELAREHHPDRAAGDPSTQEVLTTRMAHINAAYDVLRDPVRRARYDASPHAARARAADRASGAGPGGTHDTAPPASSWPPPEQPTRPVTARFDTSAAFHARDATTGRSGTPLPGQEPFDRRAERSPDLRASTPTGPVRRRRSRERPGVPGLAEARATVLEFGRFHGVTLGDVARREPTYIDWIAQTITRDRDLVMCARVIAADMDERGVERRPRASRPGFGVPGTEREAAEHSAGR